MPCRNHRSAACQALAQSPVFLITLVLVTALGPLAMSSFVPAIPAIQETFAVSGSVAQLTLSVSMVAMAIASLAYGSLADRFGRRKVLLFGIALGTVGSLICAAGPAIEWVIAGRALQAAGASSGFVLARVVVRDVYGDKRAAGVLAYVTAAMTLAPMIGPVMGGYLVDTTGWRAIFVTIAIVAALLFVIVAYRLPETRPDTNADATIPVGQGYASVLRNATYLKFLAYGTLSQAAFFGFVAGAPYVMSEILGYPATVYGFYFILVPAGYFVGSLIAGKWSHLLSNETLTLIGAIAGLVACALGWLWVAGAPLHPLALFLPAAGLAVASGIALPGAQAGMLAAAGDHAGAGSGLFSFVQLLASACAAQLVGTLQAGGPVAVFAVMVGASALGLIGYLAAAWRSPAPDAQ
ncbi:MAG: multidrug effflux MFS transporter [Gammaproteobacteria bacterium]|nr:multidrug effflux MFS transporter [Pseudomonadota bacterium]MCZ6731514.1 multidrug effflux MFS transporter [Gammaproteobacteria bacterium]